MDDWKPLAIRTLPSRSLPVRVLLVSASGFAFILASNVAREHGTNGNSESPCKHHDRYFEPVSCGMAKSLDKGKGREDQKDHTHRCLFQHHAYDRPFPTTTDSMSEEMFPMLGVVSSK
jgi:hypothetical protein